MGTTEQKLEYLATTKTKIKDSINLTGAGITNEPFRQYAVKLKDAYVDIINNGTDTLYNNFPKVSGSGTDLSLQNTYEAPMRSTLKGNTSQVQLSGKNKLNPVIVNDGTNILQQRCSVSVSDDEFTFVASGTDMYFGNVASSGNNYANNLGILIEVPTNATKVYMMATNSDFNTLFVCFYDSNKVSLGFRQVESGNVNIISGAKYINVRIGKNNATSGTTYKTKVMVSFEEITTYEQYCGGTPSPNPSYPQDIHNVSGNNSIVVCGKNLCNLLDQTKTVATNMNIVVSNQTITFNGSWSGGGNWIELDAKFSLGAGTYKLSKDTTISNFTISGMYDSISQTWVSFTTADNFILTLNNQVNIIKVRGWTNGLGTLNNATYKIQIEKGNQATTYEAYNGTTYPINLPSGMELCKIGTYEDNFLRNSGKNLIVPFSYTRTHNGITFTYLLDGSINLNGTSTGTAFAIANADVSTYTKLPVGTYTLSGGISDVLLRFDDNTGTNVANTSSSTQFTINSEMNCYIQLRIPSGKTFNNVKIYPMINEGRTALPFEPYGNGEWYLHKETGKVVLNGSETGWSRTASGMAYSFYKPRPTDSLAPLHSYYCNYFKSTIAYGNTDNSTYIGNTNVIFSNVLVNGEYLLLIDDFKTWLSTHNTIVYYVLATAKNTEITDTTLLSQLEAIYNAKSKNGTTNISQENNDLPFIITASALEKE